MLSGSGRHGPAARHVLPGSRARALVTRAALIVVVSLVAGGVAYVALPMPSAAAPGLVTIAPVMAVGPLAPAVRPGLVGGLIVDDDLIQDPVGVSTSAPDPSGDGPLIGWPVSDHTPSTGFGYRSDPFTHRQRWHDGVDLGQPCGDAVHASLVGTVAYAGWAGGYGNRIILRHADRGGQTFATTYDHLSHMDVAVGEVVQQDQVVGRVGSTGRSTACHLHFEVILGGSYVDPMRFLTGDQSKAGLSRRVGSYMPSGLPSPSAYASPAGRPSPKPTRASHSASPTPGSATPTPTPGSGSPTPGSPSPSPSPSPSSPSPTPAAATTDSGQTPGASPTQTG